MSIFRKPKTDKPPKPKITEEVLNFVLDNIYSKEIASYMILVTFQYDCNNFISNNLEHCVISELFVSDENDLYPNLHKWAEDPNTDCKILEVIAKLKYRVPKLNINFQKDFTNLTSASFNILCNNFFESNEEPNEEQMAKLIELYEPFAQMGYFHWKFIFNRNHKFFKMIPYEFDPYVEIKKKDKLTRLHRFQNPSDESIYKVLELLGFENPPEYLEDLMNNFRVFVEVNNDLECLFKIKEFVKGISAKDLAIYLGAEIFNPILSEIEEDILKFNDSDAMKAINIALATNNILINFILERFPNIKPTIDYYILTDAMSNIVEKHFKELNREVIIDILEKIEKIERLD